MAITTIEFGPRGAEDISWDLNGNDSNFTRKRSDGKFHQLKSVNASDAPTTVALRAKVNADGSVNINKDVDSTLIQVKDDLEDLGQPDEVTLSNVAGVLQINPAGIDGALIQDGTLSGDKITDATIPSSKLTGDIDGGSLAPNSVDEPSIADDAIRNRHIIDDSVGIGQLNMDNTGLTQAAFTVHIQKKTLVPADFAGDTITLLVTPIQGSLVLTDFCFAQFQDVNTGGGGRAVYQAYVSNVNEVTIRADGNVAAGDVVAFEVKRLTVAVP